MIKIVGGFPQHMVVTASAAYTVQCTLQYNVDKVNGILVLCFRIPRTSISRTSDEFNEGHYLKAENSVAAERLRLSF